MGVSVLIPRLPWEGMELGMRLIFHELNVMSLTKNNASVGQEEAVSHKVE